MMINEKNFEASLDLSNPKRKFWIRVSLDMGWLLFISMLSIFFVVKNDTTGYSWIVVIFFIFFILVGLYSSWKNEKFLLVYLKADKKLSQLKIVVNKFDNLHLEQSFPLSLVDVELKELRLGRLYVPNYILIIRYKRKVILKQRGNLAWDGDKIKEIAKKLNSIINESSNI